MLTLSQARAFEQLCLYGSAFFAPSYTGLKLKPRLFPLIVGPTGAGKTTLVKQAAEKLEANYFRITYGDWMPRGVRESAGQQTTFAILEALSADRPLVLHIDELDKLGREFDSNWQRSIATDLWNVLDGKLPIVDYLKAGDKPGIEEFGKQLQEKIDRKLWIVGSGTWQAVFSKCNAPQLGFAGKPTAANEDELVSSIRRSRMIPDELSARFASDFIVLQYPETDTEKRQLLDQFGITQLAAELRVEIPMSELNLDGLGMRKFESLATRLLLNRQRLLNHRKPVEPTVEPKVVQVSCVTALSGSAVQSDTAVRVTDPTFKRTELCLVTDAGTKSQQTPLQARIGKSREGWARVVVIDPALAEFESWCKRHTLPPPPPYRAKSGSAQISVDFQVRPLASPEELYEALLRVNHMRLMRELLIKRVERLLASVLTQPEIQELERFNSYCFTKSMSRPDFCRTIRSANTGEVMRQTKFDILKGIEIANFWLGKSGYPEGRERAAALLDRAKQMWCRAVTEHDNLSDWNSVTENLFITDALKISPASASAPTWQNLSPERRGWVAALFGGHSSEQ